MTCKSQKRVAIYIRVSTREQAMEGYSLEAQERTLTEYCMSKKYDIYSVYKDEGISAKDIIHRPGIMRLLENAKAQKFEIILVWKLTRFSRSLPNLTAVCEELDKYNVSLVSYSEAFDCTTPAGRMIRNMLGTVAQFEREVISENVAMAMLERAIEGKRTCHEIVGYDNYGKDSFTINEGEAEYVNFVHDTYMERKNIIEVTALAIQRGYKGRRGGIAHVQSIYVILTRPEYAGWNSFKGQIYKGDYKPIRTVDQFNSVQRLLMRQGKIVGRHRQRPLYIIPQGGKLGEVCKPYNEQ